MNYNEAVDYIKGLEKFGSKPGLERVSKLLEFAGNPQDKLKFVHVAGTNGKGSTCQFISACLWENGYKTGLFTSPSIHSYRERFIIDNERIPREEFAEYIQFFRKSAIEATEFELSVAIALKFFADNECNYVVLETGMGGLLDATNVIPKPEFSVLTPVSLDHTDVLGDKITDIAKQKCGIIKEGCKVFSAVQTPDVKQYIEEHYSQTVFVKEAEIVKINLESTEFIYKNEQYQILLKGVNQVANACLAIEVLSSLGLDKSQIKNGLEKAFLPYRFDVRGNIILDASHNPAGFASLNENIKTYFKGQKIDFIIGMLKEKDAETCIKSIADIVENLYIIEPESTRALGAKKLAEIAGKYVENVEIIDINKKLQDIKDITVITGSFTNFKIFSKEKE